MLDLLIQGYLEREALEGKKEDFEKVLYAVPNDEPEDYDKIV